MWAGRQARVTHALDRLQVGDRIVIASSSFFPEEVDEVVIAGVSYLSNTTTLLNISSPLRYTHLGELVSVPGEARTLDMRAEVAVLSRNVLITVRPSCLPSP